MRGQASVRHGHTQSSKILPKNLSGEGVHTRNYFYGDVRVNYGLGTGWVRVWETRCLLGHPGFGLPGYGDVRVNYGFGTAWVRV